MEDFTGIEGSQFSDEQLRKIRDRADSELNRRKNTPEARKAFEKRVHEMDDKEFYERSYGSKGFADE